MPRHRRIGFVFDSFDRAPIFLFANNSKKVDHRSHAGIDRCAWHFQALFGQ